MTLRKAEFLAYTQAQSELPTLRLAAEKAIEAFISKRRVCLEFMVNQGLNETEALEKFPTTP